MAFLIKCDIKKTRNERLVLVGPCPDCLVQQPHSAGFFQCVSKPVNARKAARFGEILKKQACLRVASSTYKTDQFSKHQLRRQYHLACAFYLLTEVILK